MTADLERFEALFADPDYDGPELPAAQQPDPGDPGVWAIWSGGRVKADHELTAARCTRWWREHPQGPPEPVAGLGLSVRGEICARRTRDGGGAP